MRWSVSRRRQLQSGDEPPFSSSGSPWPIADKRYKAVLRNPERRSYGVVDVLARSDLLASWFPELISPKTRHIRPQDSA